MTERRTTAAGISITQLARISGVDWRTADKFDRGEKVREYLATRLQTALNNLSAQQVDRTSVA